MPNTSVSGIAVFCPRRHCLSRAAGFYEIWKWSRRLPPLAVGYSGQGVPRGGQLREEAKDDDSYFQPAERSRRMSRPMDDDGIDIPYHSIHFSSSTKVLEFTIVSILVSAPFLKNLS